MSERHILVTDFAQLATGKIVVLKPCFYGCPEQHRGMLLSPGWTNAIHAERGCAVSYAMDFMLACCNDGNSTRICRCSIGSGSVYVVDDALEVLDELERRLTLVALLRGGVITPAEFERARRPIERTR